MRVELRGAFSGIYFMRHFASHGSCVCHVYLGSSGRISTTLDYTPILTSISMKRKSKKTSKFKRKSSQK